MSQIKLKSSLDLLGTEEIEIVQRGLVAVKSGFPETSGSIYRATVNHILSVTSDLINLKSNIYYSLNTYRSSRFQLKNVMYDSFRMSNYNKYDFESLLFNAPEYVEVQNIIAGLEAIHTLLDETIWSLKSMTRNIHE